MTAIPARRSAQPNSTEGTMACIAFASWMAPAAMCCFIAGVSVGFGLKFCIDYAELAAYRRAARRNP